MSYKLSSVPRIDLRTRAGSSSPTRRATTPKMSARRFPEDRPARPRRAHHKSRDGCRECKRRHIKCDEGRPCCVNCNVSSRHCEYTSAAREAATNTAPPEFPGLSHTGAAAAYTERATSPFVADYSAPHVDGRSSQTLGHDQTFTLEHMKLFHHVERGVTTWLGATGSMIPLVEEYIKTALTTPYLMDQLLALSALHTSYLVAGESARYRSLATELQTRGLSLFNAMSGDSHDPARWYFSSLLAMHNLATTLANHHHEQSFDAFLDSFISHMGLHQGTQAIGSGSWDSIRESGLRGWLDQLDGASSAASTPSNADQPMFARMLQTSRLNTASVHTCWKASSALIYVREKTHGSDSWGPHAVMAWPNLIPHDFIILLGERVPEALLILAHYAELLHAYRDYWVFGGAGEYLIRGLAERLGGSWTKWLKRPLAVLSETSNIHLNS